MDSGYIYDPDDIEGLVDLWLSDVGGEYAGQRYNGFVLLDDDRVVLDMFITDVEDEPILEWDNDRNGYDILVDRINETPGANHVIVMHGHTTSVPTGPCPGLTEFAGGMVIELATRAKTTFHFIVVLRDREIDGVLSAKLPPQVMDSLLDGDVIGARRAADALDSPDENMAQQLLESGFFDDTETVREVLELMSNGKVPDVEDLLSAINEVEARINHQPKNIRPKNINPLNLPRMELPRGDLLN